MQRPINLWCSRSKVKVKRSFLAITFVLFGMQTSYLPHIVVYGKAKNFDIQGQNEGQGHIKGQNIIWPITFFLFVVQASNLSHVVAYGKANKSLLFKVKGQGQKNIFGHNFCSIWHTDFLLVSYCSLWKGQKIWHPRSKWRSRSRKRSK